MLSVTLLTLWVALPRMFCNSGIGFNGAETICGIARILGMLIYFLTTAIIFSLSTLNFLIMSSWGTRASYSETSCDFFEFFFFFNPTYRSNIRKRINEKKRDGLRIKRIWGFFAIVYKNRNSLRKHPFLLVLRPWGSFAGGGGGGQSDTNSILMT